MLPRRTAGARCIRETASLPVVLPHGSSVAVIRVAGEDLLRAVELFQQHRADEEMRPSHGAQGENCIGLVENRLAEPFGAADREGDRSGAPIAPGGEAVGDVTARPGLPALVERDENGAGRTSGKDQCGLARL